MHRDITTYADRTRKVVRSLVCLVGAVTCLTVHGQSTGPACGALANAYGPFDYRNSPDRRVMVEPYHFPPEVEGLIRGKSGYLAGDIDYTLRAFPNHHRALLSMTRLGERLKTDHVPNATYSVECYYVRATAFMPDDTIVRMLYANYLASHQRRPEALGQLAIAQTYAGDSGFTHYNLGLLFTDLGDFDSALVEAHKAIELGFDKPDLKERLVKADKWTDAASAPR